MLRFFVPQSPPKNTGWTIKLFNRLPRAATIAQYNLAIAALSAYLYSQDDDGRASEYVPDILIHCLNAWISPQSNFLTIACASFFNLHRLATISEQLLTCAINCESSMPLLWNLFDSINHTLNLAQVIDLVAGDMIRPPTPEWLFYDQFRLY